MSQEQSSQHAISDKPFGESSDSTFRISLAVGLALMGALAAAHWATSASSATTKPTVSVEAKTSSAGSVYRCADGRVSFTPCN